MTHTDYTKKILNIEDENIYFYEDCLEIMELKQKYFMAILLIHLNVVLYVKNLILTIISLKNR